MRSALHVRIGLLAAVAAVGAGALAAPVGASGLSPAVADCNAHARLTHHYSVGELRQALATMPADVEEYTNCYSVIQQQLLSELGGNHLSGDSGNGGGSFLPTWLIVVLAVLLLGGLGFATVAWRQRGQGPGGDPS